MGCNLEAVGSFNLSFWENDGNQIYIAGVDAHNFTKDADGSGVVLSGAHNYSGVRLYTGTYSFTKIPTGTYRVIAMSDVSGVLTHASDGQNGAITYYITITTNSVSANTFWFAPNI